MKEQRTARAIARPPLQPLSCPLLQRPIGLKVARPVAFAVTPPRELARRGFPTLMDHAANVIRKPRIVDAVEDNGRNGGLAGDRIAARFKIQRDREAVFGLVSTGSC